MESKALFSFLNNSVKKGDHNLDLLMQIESFLHLPQRSA